MESSNKSHLYLAHQQVLSRVLELFAHYERILSDYANTYADLQKVEKVKGF
ncbi:MAG: hypothetical protein HC906_05355 [Bacteroidales bacterium]|nr:hypothetical protein [Bacteroidales bacterium]